MQTVARRFDGTRPGCPRSVSLTAENPAPSREHPR
jgi:hypothetical protein